MIRTIDLKEKSAKCSGNYTIFYWLVLILCSSFTLFNGFDLVVEAKVFERDIYL